MKDLVEIRTSKVSFDPVSRKTTIDYFLSIINEAKELNIWDDSIKKIVITDDLVKEVNEQARAWNLPIQHPQSKQYLLSSKILFNNNLEDPEIHLFINFLSLIEGGYSSWNIFFFQVLRVKADVIIPNEIKSFIIHGERQSLSDWVKVLAVEWCKTAYAQKRYAEIQKSSVQITNHNYFLNAFKRSLKRILFRYNSDYSDHDSKLQNFGMAYLESFNVLFTRIIENQTEDISKKISDSDEYKGFVYDVIEEIFRLTEVFQSGGFNIRKLVELIQTFSKSLDVHLLEDSNTPFEIKLTKDPKDYFVNELVDTEPRIVCFMDILGFEALVEKYDNNYESTILSDIQESFNMARRTIFEYKLPVGDEYRRRIKYQTFSDNICISIPYFDNEDDFITNFNLLMNYIRAVQASMMVKGIFIRGGVSIGSFYSDENIFFSKGLIKAYHLESKTAVYPRVVIDPDIIQKLMSYNHELISDIGTVILLDWENTAFFNPFDLARYLIKQVKSMLSDLATEIDDSDPLIMILQNFTKSQHTELINFLNNYYAVEENEIHKIVNKIKQNIDEYRDNQRVLSKYLWLLQFTKWYQKDDTCSLTFKTLTSCMQNPDSIH